LRQSPRLGCGTIICFVCDDCAQAATRASEAGRPYIVKDKFSIGDYGNIALVSDPDGNVLGFHSMA
jgi:predicted enzyme related to lactoylglutathione lyase